MTDTELKAVREALDDIKEILDSGLMDKNKVSVAYFVLKKGITALNKHQERMNSEELAEEVAIIFGGAFFGEHAAGWEDDHAIEMQKEYRIKAQAAIQCIQGDKTDG